jgi:hypothetical protein
MRKTRKAGTAISLKQCGSTLRLDDILPPGQLCRIMGPEQRLTGKSSSAEHTFVRIIIVIVAAVVGKLICTALPARIGRPWCSATAPGASMVPRAEIKLIIMGRALQQAEVIFRKTCTAMVLVAAFTCVTAPIALCPMLAGSMQQGAGGEQNSKN